MLDRIDRLETLLRYDRPDEKILRSARQAGRRSRDRRPAEQAWLDAHRGELSTVVVDMLAEARRYGRVGEDRDWLDELDVDGTAGKFSPSTMVILGSAAAELRTAPAVLELDGLRPFGVHAVLRRAEGLRCRFAECGT